MFTPYSLTVQKPCGLHENIQNIQCMLHSTLKLLCKVISCPNSARCALRNSYRSSVTCQLFFHLNKYWNINNFRKLPNKKFHENLYRALSSFMQIHTDKAMANYPQELAQDAVCQSHTGHTTGLWFLPSPAFKVEY